MNNPVIEQELMIILQENEALYKSKRKTEQALRRAMQDLITISDSILDEKWKSFCKESLKQVNNLLKD